MCDSHLVDRVQKVQNFADKAAVGNGRKFDSTISFMIM